ncbi:MAG: class I SAM-dependent methyltransferase [Myxococcales bacterium]|nr:class I SAM-dependent methyltransferase [Myxococcales bacterium]
MTDAYGDALVAAVYEVEYGPLEGDVAWFSRHSDGDRLLVLGCGTGRVARRLAGGRRRVTGLDRSPAMLEVARRIAPSLDWIVGDMRDFTLGSYDEIIVPNGGFSFLPTRADQASCLTSCRRALKVGGSLTIDLPMPDFGRWAQAHTPERDAWEGRLDDRVVRRTRETTRSLARQRLDLLDRYYVDDRLVTTSALRLRVMLPSELEWMLEASGFWVDRLVGDYGGTAIRDGSPRILARAVAG